MKNFFLFTKNINNYGIWIFLNIIFFEIKFFFETNNINSLNHDSEFTSDYNETKTKKNYNTPYIPTPYYFFYIIKNFLKKNNLNNFTFIDFGCGYSRSLFFLKKFFNLKFIGIDLNKRIIKKMQNFKSHKSFFFDYNLKDYKKRKKVINFIKKKKLEKKEIIVFFSDSFDVFNLKKVMDDFARFDKLYLILVNTKNYEIFKNKFIIVNKFFFKNKNRNVIILKNAKK